MLKRAFPAFAVLACILANAAGAAEFVPISIVCVKTEDVVGADHVYLQAGGKTIWGPKQMSKGDSLQIVGKSVKFAGDLEIELYEKDTPDQDDLLGNESVYAAQAGARDRVMRFTNDGAQYVLTYRIVP